METTYRLIVLNNPEICGRTAASAELAKLVPGHLDRTQRLGIERTDWVPHFDKMKIHRSVVVEAEESPGEWTIGA